jgi:hypothetical protein
MPTFEHRSIIVLATSIGRYCGAKVMPAVASTLRRQVLSLVCLAPRTRVGVTDPAVSSYLFNIVRGNHFASSPFVLLRPPPKHRLRRPLWPTGPTITPHAQGHPNPVHHELEQLNVVFSEGATDQNSHGNVPRRLRLGRLPQDGQDEPAYRSRCSQPFGGRGGAGPDRRT